VRVVALGCDGQYLACGVVPTGNRCVVRCALMRACVRYVTLEARGVLKCMALLRALSWSVLARRGFAASEWILRQEQAGGWSMLTLCGVGVCVASADAGWAAWLVLTLVCRAALTLGCARTLALSDALTHTHALTRPRMHARTHSITHTQAYTHTLTLMHSRTHSPSRAARRCSRR